MYRGRGRARQVSSPLRYYRELGGERNRGAAEALTVSGVRSSIQLRARPCAPPSTRMVSFILCLLPALLATTSAQGDTLKCSECAIAGDTCQNVELPCTVPKATGGCITVAEENTLVTTDGSKFTGFSRRCLSDYTSGIKDLITLTAGKDKYLRISTTRCNNADNCNSGTLAAPKGSTTANGLQCPTCFALNSDPCHSQITPCTGNETYCVDFAGYLVNGTVPSDQATFVAKGCATASAQNIKSLTTRISTIYTYVFTQATSKPAEKATSGASPALGRFSFTLYLPGLTGLLLVKLLS
ncbi:phospholipase A2 inhibitor and Ly6/PLAUR domain-containing protein-like [Mauremys reevesii]|uniref:phospholipase A2 inhibitor and Ly6/PLAUR domain-containing protein-like n=1 Tax=Mauremys reevesii TaxID=260615 RepID=UPI00193F6FA9|nr:phospholipase A2 inhibitor and Ly6/PLAUR domain-containing protein-like [Mauremys reevesii]